MGKIAHDQHVPVIAKNPDFNLAAVVSQRGVSLPGVRSFRTARDLYAAMPGIEAVAICTPPSARHALARDALAAGKHLLLEKPPAQTLAELIDVMSEAQRLERVLFATWHSRFNAAVAEAKRHLQNRKIRSLHIEWKEDVRRWHPGQEWIWRPGGFGVFDPGINALSIVTAILPSPLLLRSADLSFPQNREMPIAARLELGLAADPEARLAADFDWRQTGEQTWNITIELDGGEVLRLLKGGARLEADGKLVVEEAPAEYEAIYRHFSDLLKHGASDVDPAPLQLVADAFMLGRRIEVEPFEG
jgi:D-galactose 1-dehydrogenase